MGTLSGSPHAAAGPVAEPAPAFPAGCGLIVAGHGTADPLVARAVVERAARCGFQPGRPNLA